MKILAICVLLSLCIIASAYLGLDWLPQIVLPDWLLQIVLTGAGIVLGGMINWFFSRRASEELRRQANDLRRLNGLTIRILEQANLLPDNVEPTKDEKGEYTGGLTYKAAAVLQGRSSAHATGRVTRPDESTPPAQEPAEQKARGRGEADEQE